VQLLMCFALTLPVQANLVWFVTGFRVLQSARQQCRTLHVEIHAAASGKPSDRILEYIIDFGTVFVHPSQDLAAIPLGLSGSDFNIDGLPAFWSGVLDSSMIPSDEALLAVPFAQAILLSFPDGIWDHVHHLPISRLVHCASNPGVNYKNKLEVLINTMSYPGDIGALSPSRCPSRRGKRR
jgi:hypothetical protein